MTESPFKNTDQEELIARLEGALDRATAVELVSDVVRTTNRSETATQVLELLDELKEASSKATQGAVEALLELRRRAALQAVVPWLDLGVALAGSSGAAAIKYFKESPLILGLIESTEARRQVLVLALELAENDPNVALDWFRKSPELLTVLPADQLASWAEVGVELARLDYVVGIEFFRQSPAMAQVIPLTLVRTWVGFGMKLVTQNSLGKTDYLGTLEFFRTGPAILGEVEGAGARQAVVELGSGMADHSPTLAIAFLAEAPTILRRLPSEEWRTKVLQYGVLVAERDAEAVLAYVRRCPEILGLIGSGEQGAEKFEEWYRGGMEILEYSPEGARAYFALETRKALASIEQAISGVPLRQIARSVKLFAQGLCGADVTIRSLPDLDPAGQLAPESLRAAVSPDGRTIALPALLRRYPTREENLRLYTVMTAHEAGHLEFGTYSLSLGRLADLIHEVRTRYRPSPPPSPIAHRNLESNGHPGEDDGEGQSGIAHSPRIQSLKEVFALYPQPGLVRDLWTVLEDARVEYRLQHEYPGLKRDLAALARESVRTRSFTHGLSVREMIVDYLLLLTTAEPGTVRIPDSIADIVDRLWALCQRILTPTASAEETIRLVDRLYLTMEEMLASTACDVAAHEEEATDRDLGAGPKASEEVSGQYRPVTNWAYRGAMNPDMVRDRGGEAEGTDQQIGHEMPVLGREVPFPGDIPHAESSAEGLRPPKTEGGQSPGSVPSRASGLSAQPPGDASGPGRIPPSIVEQMLAVGIDQREGRESAQSKDRAFLYDEWDGLIQDYRSGWCRVIERVAPEGSRDFAEATLAAHGPAVRLLRRYFESIRPPGLRRVHGQPDGEELDLDASIRRIADRKAGVEPSDRIYLRREKRERDVAAAFLVDLSGSTSRQIESPAGSSGRRVIDVEKEGLVLLCEALEAIGDQYGVYGYSGRGREQVEFVILKEFDEPAHGRTAQRIGSIGPMHQNRDGAAIRHAAYKLLAQDARVRLLVLISDGKPLDDGYADEYALEDTKMALREGRIRGIEPFCITVDRGADEYLRRMYGEVRYVIIDHVAALPERLPRIYQRLTA